MNTIHITAKDRKHLDSLTADYRRTGWNIVTYTPTFRELEKKQDFILIRVAKEK